MAQSSRLDTIANNLANVNTAAFKKDRQVFSEYLSAHEKENNVINVPRIPASIESFYDMQGGDTAYVNPSGTYTNFEQGALRSTGSNLDMAIEGRGFFEVLTPQGLRFTRNGALHIDNTGRLVTREGFPVLRDGQNDPAQRMIQVSGGNLTVSKSGEIFDGGNNIGRLAVSDFALLDDLQKVGNSLYALKGNARSGPVPAGEARIHQGFTEGSNVNVIEEMTDMMSATRSFETSVEVLNRLKSMQQGLLKLGES